MAERPRPGRALTRVGALRPADRDRTGPTVEGEQPGARPVAVGRRPRPAPGDEPALDVLDLGGGTGGLAVPLAALGHRVTVVDPSPDALAALARRAEEAGRGRAARSRPRLQGDADVSCRSVPSSLDLVLCHGVLEHVDDPAACPGRRRPRPAARLAGSAWSLAQRSAAVVAAALVRPPGPGPALLDDPAGRWGEHDPLARRFDRAGVVDAGHRRRAGVVDVHGLRILGDLVARPAARGDPAARGPAARPGPEASRPDPGLRSGLAAALTCSGPRARTEPP